MSGKTTYTLLLNSANTVNQISTPRIGAYTYYVNWGAILPNRCKIFDLSYQFRTTTSTTDPVNSVIVSVNMGSTSLYDQSSSQSNILGSIIPRSYVTGSTPRYFYESNNTDDCGFMVNYPSNNYITISIVNFNGSAVTNFPSGYILQLCFTVIEE